MISDFSKVTEGIMNRKLAEQEKFDTFAKTQTCFYFFR